MTVGVLAEVYVEKSWRLNSDSIVSTQFIQSYPWTQGD